MTTTTPIDLSVIDANEIKKFKNKKKRADRVIEVIRENGLENDKEFMDEIDPLIEELLKN